MKWMLALFFLCLSLHSYRNRCCCCCCDLINSLSYRLISFLLSTSKRIQWSLTTQIHAKKNNTDTCVRFILSFSFYIFGSIHLICGWLKCIQICVFWQFCILYSQRVFQDCHIQVLCLFGMFCYMHNVYVEMAPL